MSSTTTEAGTPEHDSDSDGGPRAGRVAIMGRPNTGKSTFLNAVLAQTLAVTTDRPGTTRSSILGVHYIPSPPTQIAFVDTPGIGHSRTALHRLLVDTARQSLIDVDAILMVAAIDAQTDATSALRRDRRVLGILRELDETMPIVIALNKVDLVADKSKLLPILSAYQSAIPSAVLVPISALRNNGVDRVLSELRQALPAGQLYEPSFLTDRPQRFFAAEFVRAAAMEALYDELPYGVAVTIDAYEESPRITSIQATLVVEKESHKGMVIGKQGAQLKSIGTRARKQIEAHLGQKVMLKLWVKVVPQWTQNAQKARELIDG